MWSDRAIAERFRCNYIFGLIDVATKELFTAPLKNKTALATSKALENVIDDNDLKISVIQSDNGLEFFSEFSQLLQKQKYQANILKGIITMDEWKYRKGLGNIEANALQVSDCNGNQTLGQKFTNIDGKLQEYSPVYWSHTKWCNKLPRSELTKRIRSSSVKIVEPKQDFKIGEQSPLRIRDSSKLGKASDISAMKFPKLSELLRETNRSSRNIR